MTTHTLPPLTQLLWHHASSCIRFCNGPHGSCAAPLQLPMNSKMEVHGAININGMPATESNHRQAYVQQEDVFYSQLTVLEVRACITHMCCWSQLTGGVSCRCMRHSLLQSRLTWCTVTWKAAMLHHAG